MRQTLTLVLAMLTLSTVSIAQISTPAPSPTANFTQTVGLTDVTINYSRPSMKDRTIFAADGLVPYGQIWRTGANAATTIEFSRDVNFGGADVPAGKYAVYSIPGASEWTVMLYSDLSLGGNVGGYDEANEVMRTTVPAVTMDISLETLTLDLGDLRDNKATFGIVWDNVYVPVPLVVHTHDQVMEQIENFAANPMSDVAANYLNSGWYIYATDGDLEQALDYMSAGCKHSTSPFLYFWLGRKAEVQAAAGDYKGAIATAKQAHKAGEEAPDNARGFYDNTVKDQLNKNIQEWNSKM